MSGVVYPRLDMRGSHEFRRPEPSTKTGDPVEIPAQTPVKSASRAPYYYALPPRMRATRLGFAIRLSDLNYTRFSTILA